MFHSSYFLTHSALLTIARLSTNLAGDEPLTTLQQHDEIIADHQLQNYSNMIWE